jgi:hypothetical protein
MLLPNEHLLVTDQHTNRSKIRTYLLQRRLARG